MLNTSKILKLLLITSVTLTILSSQAALGMESTNIPTIPETKAKGKNANKNAKKRVKNKAKKATENSQGNINVSAENLTVGTQNTHTNANFNGLSNESDNQNNSESSNHSRESGNNNIELNQININNVPVLTNNQDQGNSNHHNISNNMAVVNESINDLSNQATAVNNIVPASSEGYRRSRRSNSDSNINVEDLEGSVLDINRPSRHRPYNEINILNYRFNNNNISHIESGDAEENQHRFGNIINVDGDGSVSGEQRDANNLNLLDESNVGGNVDQVNNFDVNNINNFGGEQLNENNFNLLNGNDVGGNIGQGDNLNVHNINDLGGGVGIPVDEVANNARRNGISEGQRAWVARATAIIYAQEYNGHYAREAAGRQDEFINDFIRNNNGLRDQVLTIAIERRNGESRNVIGVLQPLDEDIVAEIVTDVYEFSQEQLNVLRENINARRIIPLEEDRIA
jgi:hypothetical protein